MNTLSSINYADLQRNGFAKIESLVSASQIAEFEDKISQLAETGLRRKGMVQGANEAMSDLLKTGGKYRVRLFTNLKYLKIVQELGETARHRIEASGFLDWAKVEVPAIWPILRADPPGETKYLLPYHQDFATQCLNAWRFWIPLRHANAENGTIEVVPQSHKLGYIEHDFTNLARPVIPRSFLDTQDPIVLDVAAGDGIIINPLLFHASVPATKNVMKYVLLTQVHDMATIADEDDPNDILAPRLALAEARDIARDGAVDE